MNTESAERESNSPYRAESLSEPSVSTAHTLALTEREYAFLTRDWEAAHKTRDSYSVMRIAIAGFWISILSGIISFGSGDNAANALLPYALLGLVSAGISMLGSTNRAVYVFGLHMAMIEEELGEDGFASIWPYYVRANVKDSANAAFYRLAELVNIGITALVAFPYGADLWNYLACNKPTISLYSSVPAAMATTLFFVNRAAIQRDLHPERFIPRILENFSLARSSMRDDRKKKSATSRRPE